MKVDNISINFECTQYPANSRNRHVEQIRYEIHTYFRRYYATGSMYKVSSRPPRSSDWNKITTELYTKGSVVMVYEATRAHMSSAGVFKQIAGFRGHAYEVVVVENGKSMPYSLVESRSGFNLMNNR